MIAVNACAVCRRLRREGAQPTDAPGSCSAFPDGVPEVIWSGEHAHRVKVTGDHGLLFDGKKADHALYVESFELLTGEAPQGMPVPEPAETAG